MNYLIDTNVISETFRNVPNENVIAWFKAVPADNLYLSVLTIGEIRKGIEQLKTSQRKNQLVLWFDQRLPKFFDQRILAITTEISERWGYINAHSPRTLPAIDGLIAATALVHNLKIVTRNSKDFDFPEIEVINPFLA